MDKNLKVNISGVVLKNPVMTASGTFASGEEYSQFVDINRLGGIVVKGLSHKPWKGNKPPRIAETYGGMLNSVGLQNLGAEAFIKNDLPFLKRFDTKIVVNLCGHTVEDYIQVTKDFKNIDVDLLELNISCPNITKGGLSFGTDAKMVEHVVREVKKYATKPLIVKLTPNVSDIVEIAKAAESGGADAISLINTIMAMRIDIHRRRPVLANKIGGLSGPAIKPVAVRMVYLASKAVSIPIIGMGGITTGEDAIEFIMAGATAIAVGTANFINPYATIDVLDGIERFMEKENIKDIQEIRGII